MLRSNNEQRIFSNLTHRYTWIRLTEHEQKDAYDTGLPFFTPTLVGCAIAVEKNYFNHIGRFDDGMKVWGGENIELAFRL